MRFSDGFLDEIRQRLPIHEVVGEQVIWDKRKSQPGRGDYWACCPFHGEKSPSFHCEDKKGRYHCFGCSVSGDHFKFLTELDGMSFPEAVEKIADMAGVPMPVRDEQEERREKERGSLTDVMEMATAFFQERLQGPEGAKARAYLRDRGLTPATQQSFRLGFAPDSRNALKEHLAAKGVPKADLLIRSHVHYFGVAEHASKQIVTTPCWELQTRYMRKFSVHRMHPDIGGIKIEIDGKAKKRGEAPCRIIKELYSLPPVPVTQLETNL